MRSEYPEPVGKAGLPGILPVRHKARISRLPITIDIAAPNTVHRIPRKDTRMALTKTA